MKSKKSKSVFFKIVKFTGILLTFIVAFLFAAPFIFADKIKEQVKKTANENLAAELNYSDVSISFFNHFPSLTLTLNDLKLNGSTPYQNENFISSKEVSFGISVTSLLFGETINIDEIYVSNASINVKVNQNGVANYNIYKSKAKEQTVKDRTENSLKLEKIQIINSKIVYDDQSTKMHFDAFGFDYIGKGDLSHDVFDLYSKAKIDKLNVSYQNEQYLMNKKIDADLITKVNISSLSFLFQQNDLKINQLVVDFKGKFEILKEGYNMDLNIKSTNSNLYDVFTALPPVYIKWLSKTDLMGKTNLALSLKGKYITSQNLAPDLKLDLTVKDGYVNYNKSPFPVSNLNLDIKTSVPSLNPNLAIIDAKQFNLNIDKNFVTSVFYIKGIQNPDINLSLQSNIDLEKLSEAIAIPGISLKGSLITDIVAKGVYNKEQKLFPITKGSINLKNGYLKTKYYPNPITDIAINAMIENKNGIFQDLNITLKPAQLTFEGNPFFVTAALANFEDLNYDIQAKGILNVSKIYKVFSQKGLNVDGSIKADVVLKGTQSDAEKGNYSKLYNKGTLELRNILIATEYLPNKFLIKEGIFRIDQDKMSFENFISSYGQSDFRMTGYLQNVFNFVTTDTGVLRGSFALNATYINVDEFMTSNEVKTTNETETEPIIVVEKGVIMIPSTLDLQFQANAQKVHFNGLNLTETKGKLNLKNTVVTLQNTGFKLIGTTVAMNAKYQGITPEKAQFEYNIKADDFNIKRAYDEIAIFREMASAAEKAQGIVSLEYQLKGRLNANMEPIYPSLTGNGIVSIKDIKLYGMKMFNAVAKKTSNEGFKNPELSKVTIKTSIKNNIITVEKFKFKFAGFRPRIEGTTSLDGKLNIKMRLGLPPLGIIGIPMVITGDKDNPKVKVGKQSDDLKETEETDNK